MPKKRIITQRCRRSACLRRDCHIRVTASTCLWRTWDPLEISFALTLLEYQVFQRIFQDKTKLLLSSRCSSLIMPSRWHWLIVPNPPSPLVWRVWKIPRTVASRTCFGNKRLQRSSSNIGISNKQVFREYLVSVCKYSPTRGKRNPRTNLSWNLRI